MVPRLLNNFFIACKANWTDYKNTICQMVCRCMSARLGRLEWNNTSKLLLVCEPYKTSWSWLSQTLLLADLQYWVIWTDLGEPVRLDINIKQRVTVMRRTPAGTQAKNEKTSTWTLMPGQIVSRMWWFLTSVSSGFWFSQFYSRDHGAKIQDLFALQREYDNKSLVKLLSVSSENVTPMFNAPIWL